MNTFKADHIVIKAAGHLQAKTFMKLVVKKLTLPLMLAGLFVCKAAVAGASPPEPAQIQFYIKETDYASGQKYGFYAYTNQQPPKVDVYLYQKVSSGGDWSYTNANTYITYQFALTNEATADPTNKTYTSRTSGVITNGAADWSTTFTFQNLTGNWIDNICVCYSTSTNSLPQTNYITYPEVTYVIPIGGLGGWHDGYSWNCGSMYGACVSGAVGCGEFMAGAAICDSGGCFSCADNCASPTNVSATSESFVNTNLLSNQYQTVDYTLDNIYPTITLKQWTINQMIPVYTNNSSYQQPTIWASGGIGFTNLLHYPDKYIGIGDAYTALTSDEMSYTVQAVTYKYIVPDLEDNQQYILCERLTVATNGNFYKAYIRMSPASSSTCKTGTNGLYREIRITPHFAAGLVMFDVDGQDLSGEVGMPGTNANDLAITSISLTRVALWKRSDFDLAKPCFGTSCQGNCVDGSWHAEGMPVWRVSEPDISVWLKDTPLSYQTSLGQMMSFELLYSQRDARLTNTCVPITGCNHNWNSYVHITQGFDLIGSGPSFNFWTALAYEPDGGVEQFRYDQLYNPDSGNEFAGLGGNPDVSGCRISHSDGSVDIYQLVSPQYDTDDSSLLANTYTGHMPTGILARNSAYFLSRLPVYDWKEVDDWSNSNSTNRTGMKNYDSIETYTRKFGSSSSGTGGSGGGVVSKVVAADAVLTAHVDKYGNVTRFNYDTQNGGDLVQYFLHSVVDCDGKTNTLSYDGNQHLITVVSPYGKSAQLSHDSNGKLISVTDAQGMASTITYYKGAIASLCTPYGTTTFDITDYGDGLGYAQSETGISRAVKITNPNGSKEIYAYRYNCYAIDDIGVPKILTPPDQVGGSVWDGGVLGDPEINQMGDGLFCYRNSFYWGPKQTTLLSNSDYDLTQLTAKDYSLARLKHWRMGRTEGTIGNYLSVMRDAAPDTNSVGIFTWYSEDGASTQMPPLTPNASPLSEIVVARILDGVTSFEDTHLAYGLPTSVTGNYTKPDGSVGERTIIYNYKAVTNTLIGPSYSNSWIYFQLSGVTGYKGEPFWTIQPSYTTRTNVINP